MISLPCTFLAWDTKFFGVRIARVNANRLTPESAAAIDAWCAENSIACVYFLADADDPQTARLAETHGFNFVDIRLTFEHTRLQTRSKSSPSMSSATIRPFKADDIPTLEAVSRASYTDSRYYFDLRFPRERCDALYETWIRRECEAAANDPEHHAVVVAQLNGQAAGFVSCHVLTPPPAPPRVTGRGESGVGSIGLVGVAETARGQQIGTAVVSTALDWFQERGCDSVTVVTQGRNIGAQRLYQRCGFVTQSVQLWYHKWFGTQN